MVLRPTRRGILVKLTPDRLVPTFRLALATPAPIAMFRFKGTIHAPFQRATIGIVLRDKRKRERTITGIFWEY